MRKLILIPIFLMLAIGLSAGAALANTAANTEIINNATLTFTGGSASATVTVTVALVPSQPNLVITDATGAYTAPDTPALTNSLIITSTANGPADYTTTSSVSADTNTSGGGVSGDTTVTIGASVTTGTSAQTYVTVPSGGASGNDATVNGIAVNDTIVFSVNGNTYTRQVTSTTDNGDGTFRLNWSGAIPAADVPAAGVQVGEQQTVNLSVTPGTVTVPGTDITVEITTDVSTAGVADTSITNTNPNTWTTPSPNVNMTKYVRNVTDAGANPAVGGTSFTIEGATNDYFTAGVTGAPGDVLEYLILASNVGATDLTGSAISDLLPEAFVTLVNNAYGTDEIAYRAPGAAGTVTLPAGAVVGASQATFVSGNDPNLIVNVGNGADDTNTGDIPPAEDVIITYQVTIN